ncbi:MAG: tetratricopeptide repeat protein [Candidatus Omnitrophota bacterium]
MKKAHKRIIALIVALIFCIEQTGFAEVGARPSAVQEVPRHELNINQFSIPSDIAITKYINKTDSEKLIINIKDIHDNYGTQKSIVDVLDNLLVNYDVRFVGIEGSEGYIDTSVISAFEDEEAKRIGADYLMREGKISAGEFFAALSKTPVKLYGIDDSQLYLKNYYAFLSLLEKKEENLKEINSLREALYALEDYVFSEDLKLLNRNSVLNGNNGTRFTKRWDFVKVIGLKHGIATEDCQNITALEQAVQAEKTIDYIAVNTERDELLNLLTDRVGRNTLEELVLKSLSFKLGKISKSQFYTYLLILAKAEGLAHHYLNLEKFCDYVTLYESIDIAQLMDEIDNYECRIREKLYRNEEEKTLTDLLKKTEILHDLYNIRLTSGQLKYLMTNIGEFSETLFYKFLDESHKKYSLSFPDSLSFPRKYPDGHRRESIVIFNTLPNAITFYKAATERNQKMVENTIEQMRKENVDVAAVVTGGFHTRGITDILKSDNVSYLILLPRFNTKTGKRPYVTILTNKAAEYEKYVKSGDYLALWSVLSIDETILKGVGITKEQLFERLYELIVPILGASILRNKDTNVKDTYLDSLLEKKAGQSDYDTAKEFIERLKTNLDISVSTQKDKVTFKCGNFGQFEVTLTQDEETTTPQLTVTQLTTSVIPGEAQMAESKDLTTSPVSSRGAEDTTVLLRGHEVPEAIFTPTLKDRLTSFFQKALSLFTTYNITAFSYGFSLKRIGTDQKTGQVVRDFFTDKKIKAYKKTAGTNFTTILKDTSIVGNFVDEVRVIKENLGKVAASYRFETTINSKKVLVIVTNYSNEFNDMMGDQYDRVIEEAIFHEQREHFWVKTIEAELKNNRKTKKWKILAKNKIPISRAAHIIAGSEQLQRYGQKDTNGEISGLNAYSLMELQNMDIPALKELILEDRTMHNLILTMARVRVSNLFKQKANEILEKKKKENIQQIEHHIQKAQKTVWEIKSKPDELRVKFSDLNLSKKEANKLKAELNDKIRELETEINLAREKLLRHSEAPKGPQNEKLTIEIDKLEGELVSLKREDIKAIQKEARQNAKLSPDKAIEKFKIMYNKFTTLQEGHEIHKEKYLAVGKNKSDRMNKNADAICRIAADNADKAAKQAEKDYMIFAKQVTNGGFNIEKYLQSRFTKKDIDERLEYGFRLKQAASEYDTNQEQAAHTKEGAMVQKNAEDQVNEWLREISSTPKEIENNCLHLRQKHFYEGGNIYGKLNVFGNAINNKLVEGLGSVEELVKEHGENIYYPERSGTAHAEFIKIASGMFLLALIMEKGYTMETQDLRLLEGIKLSQGKIIQFPTGEGKGSGATFGNILRALNFEGFGTENENTGRPVISYEKDKELAQRNARDEKEGDGMGGVYRRFLQSARFKKSVRVVSNESTEAELTAAFTTPGVTYIAFPEMAFLTQRDEQSKKKIFGKGYNSQTRDIELYFVNFDEIDDILLDQFLTSFQIAEFGGPVKEPLKVFHQNLAIIAYCLKNNLKTDVARLGKKTITLFSDVNEELDTSICVVDRTGVNIHNVWLTKFGKKMVKALHEKANGRISGYEMEYEEFEEYFRRALTVEIAYVLGKDYVIADLSVSDAKEKLSEKISERGFYHRIGLISPNGPVTDQRLSELGMFIEAKHTIPRDDAEANVTINEDNEIKSWVNGVNVTDSVKAEHLAGASGTMPKALTKGEVSIIFHKNEDDLLEFPRRHERVVIELPGEFDEGIEKFCEDTAKKIKDLREKFDSPPIAIIAPKGDMAREIYHKIREALDIPDGNIDLISVNKDVPKAEKYGARPGHVLIGSNLVGRAINMSPMKIEDGIEIFDSIISFISESDNNTTATTLLDNIKKICAQLVTDPQIRERTCTKADSIEMMELKEELEETLRELVKQLAGNDNNALKTAHDERQTAETNLAKKEKALKSAIKKNELARDEDLINEIISVKVRNDLKLSIDSDTLNNAKSILKKSKVKAEIEDVIRARVWMEQLAGSGFSGSEHLKAVFEAEVNLKNARGAGKKNVDAEVKAVQKAKEKLKTFDNSLEKQPQRLLNAFQIIMTKAVNGLQESYIKMSSARRGSQTAGRAARWTDPGSITEHTLMDVDENYSLDRRNPSEEGTVSDVIDKALHNVELHLSWWEKIPTLRRITYGTMRDKICTAYNDARNEWITLKKKLRKNSLNEEERKALVLIQKKLEIFASFAYLQADKMDSEERIRRSYFARLDDKKRKEREKLNEETFKQKILYSEVIEERYIDGEIKNGTASPLLAEKIIDLIFERAIAEIKKDLKALSKQKENTTEKQKEIIMKNIKELREHLEFFEIDKQRIAFSLAKKFTAKNGNGKTALLEDLAVKNKKSFKSVLKKLNGQIKKDFAGTRIFDFEMLHWTEGKLISGLLSILNKKQAKTLAKTHNHNIPQRLYTYTKFVDKQTKKLFGNKYRDKFAEAFYEKVLKENWHDESKKTPELLKKHEAGDMLMASQSQALKEISKQGKWLKWFKKTKVGGKITRVFDKIFYYFSAKWQRVRGNHEKKESPIRSKPVEVGTVISTGILEKSVTSKQGWKHSVWEKKDTFNETPYSAESAYQPDNRATVEERKTQEQIKKAEKDALKKTESAIESDAKMSAAMSSVVTGAALAASGMSIPAPGVPVPVPVPPIPQPKGVVCSLTVYGKKPEEEDKREYFAAIDELVKKEKEILRFAQDDGGVAVIIDDFDTQSEKDEHGNITTRIIITKAKLVYERDGVIVVRYIGKKTKDDPFIEGDLWRAGYEAPEGKTVLLVGDDTTGNLDALMQDLINEAAQAKVEKKTVIAVNSAHFNAETNKVEINGIKIISVKDGFKAAKSVAFTAKRINPDIDDKELSEKLTNTSNKTNILAFNRNSRRLIANKTDNLLVMEDIGPGEFSKDFMLYAYILGKEKARVHGTFDPSMMDLTELLSGKKGQGIQNDPIFGDVFTLNDIPPDEIKIASATSRPRNDGGVQAILKIGNCAKFTENYINGKISELPVHKPLHQGNRLRFLLNRFLEPLMVWIELSPNPNTCRFVVSACVIIALFVGLPYLVGVGILGFSAFPFMTKCGIIASNFIVGAGVLLLWKKAWSKAEESKHPRFMKGVVITTAAILAVFTIFIFYKISLISAVANIFNSGWTSKASFKLLGKRLFPVMMIGSSLLGPNLINLVHPKKKAFPWLRRVLRERIDKIVEPEKERSKAISREILGFTGETAEQIRKKAADALLDSDGKDPKQVLKDYEMALRLYRHIPLEYDKKQRKKEKRVLSLNIAKTGKKIIDHKKRFGIKDKKTDSMAAFTSGKKDLRQETKEAAKEALGENQNVFKRIWFKIFAKPPTSKELDEMRIILAKFAIEDKDGQAALKYINKIFSSNPDKHKLHNEFAINAENLAESLNKKAESKWFPKIKSVLKYAWPVVLTLGYVFKRNFGTGVSAFVLNKFGSSRKAKAVAAVAQYTADITRTILTPKIFGISVFWIAAAIIALAIITKFIILPSLRVIKAKIERERFLKMAEDEKNAFLKVSLQNAGEKIRPLTMREKKGQVIGKPMAFAAGFLLFIQGAFIAAVSYTNFFLWIPGRLKVLSVLPFILNYPFFTPAFISINLVLSFAVVYFSVRAVKLYFKPPNFENDANLIQHYLDLCETEKNENKKKHLAKAEEIAAKFNTERNKKRILTIKWKDEKQWLNIQFTLLRFLKVNGASQEEINVILGSLDDEDFKIEGKSEEDQFIIVEALLAIPPDSRPDNWRDLLKNVYKKIGQAQGPVPTITSEVAITTVIPSESTEGTTTVIPSESTEVTTTVIPSESTEVTTTVIPSESTEVTTTVIPSESTEVTTTVIPEFAEGEYPGSITKKYFEWQFEQKLNTAKLQKLSKIAKELAQNKDEAQKELDNLKEAEKDLDKDTPKAITPIPLPKETSKREKSIDRKILDKKEELKKEKQNPAQLYFDLAELYKEKFKTPEDDKKNLAEFYYYKAQNALLQKTPQSRFKSFWRYLTTDPNFIASVINTIFRRPVLRYSSRVYLINETERNPLSNDDKNLLDKIHRHLIEIKLRKNTIVKHIRLGREAHLHGLIEAVEKDIENLLKDKDGLKKEMSTAIQSLNQLFDVLFMRKNYNVRAPWPRTKRRKFIGNHLDWIKKHEEIDKSLAGLKAALIGTLSMEKTTTRHRMKISGLNKIVNELTNRGKMEELDKLKETLKSLINKQLNFQLKDVDKPDARKMIIKNIIQPLLVNFFEVDLKLNRELFKHRFSFSGNVETKNCIDLIWLQWLERTIPSHLARRANETDDEYNKRVQGINKSLEGFLNDLIKDSINNKSDEIQDAVLKIVKTLISNPKVDYKVLIDGGLKYLRTQESIDPDNTFLLKLKILFEEQTLLKRLDKEIDKVEKFEMNDFKQLEELIALYSKGLYYEKIISVIERYFSDTNERAGIIKKILGDVRINTSKLLLNGLFRQELQRGQNVSAKIIINIMGKLKENIGEDETQFSFKDVLGKTREILNIETIYKEDTGIIKQIIDEIILNRCFEDIEKFANLLNNLDLSVKIRLVNVIHDFAETMLSKINAPSPTTEKDKIIKENLIISITNLLSSIAYTEDKDIVLPMSVLNLYKDHLKPLKQNRKKEAQQKLWDAKEWEYKEYLLQAAIFEAEEKGEDTIKEYEKIIELFKEEVEDPEVKVTVERLISLNNRIITAYKAIARIYANVGNTAQSELFTGKANKWIALHPQQTVVTEHGKAWEAYIKSLENTIKAKPDDPEVRKQYADALVSDYIDALQDYTKQYELKQRIEKEKKQIENRIDKLNKQKSDLEEEIKEFRIELRTSEIRIDEMRKAGSEYNTEWDELARKGKKTKSEISEKGESLNKIEANLKAQQERLKTIKKSLENQEKDTKKAEKKKNDRKKGLTPPVIPGTAEAAPIVIPETAEAASIVIPGEGEARDPGSIINNALNKYLDAIELPDESKKEGQKTLKDTKEKLIAYVYHNPDRFPELIKIINERLNRIKYTEPNRKKRYELEKRLRKLRLELAESAFGLLIITRTFLQNSNQENVTIGRVSFTAIEVFEYIQDQYKQSNKTSKLAWFLLTIYADTATPRLLRVIALSDFIDLIYEQLNLSTRKDKELPSFDKFFREVLQKVFKLPKIAEMQDAETLFRGKAVNALSIFYDWKKLPKEGKEAWKNEKHVLLTNALSVLESVYEILKARHLDRVDLSGKNTGITGITVKFELLSNIKIDSALKDVIAKIAPENKTKAEFISELLSAMKEANCDAWHKMNGKKKRLFLVSQIPAFAGMTGGAGMTVEIETYDPERHPEQELMDEADAIWQKARKTTDFKEFHRAIAKYKEAIEIAPENSTAHYKLAKAHHYLKHFDEALKEARAAIEKDPFNFESHRLIIDIHRILSDPLKLYKAYISLTEAYKKKGEKERENRDEYKALENFKKALETLEIAEDIAPHRAESYVLRAELSVSLQGVAPAVSLRGREAPEAILHNINKILTWQDYSRVRKFLSFRKKRRIPMEITDSLVLRARLIRAKIRSENQEVKKAFSDYKKAEKMKDNSKETFLGMAQGYGAKYKIASSRKAFILKILPLSGALIFLSACTGAKLAFYSGVFNIVKGYVFATLPYVVLTLIIVVPGVLIGHYLYKYIFVLPKTYKTRAYTYYNKTIEKDKTDIELYRKAVNFAKEAGDKEKAGAYAKRAIDNVKVEAIVNKTDEARTKRFLNEMSMAALNGLKEGIQKDLKWRVRDFILSPSKYIQRLRGALTKIDSAEKVAEKMFDSTEKIREQSALKSFKKKAHKRIVKLHTWFWWNISSFLRKKHRYNARLSHARVLIAQGTKIDLAIRILKDLRGKSAAPSVEKDLFEAYVAQKAYDKALEIEPNNRKIQIKKKVSDFQHYTETVPESKQEIIEDLEKALSENILSDDEKLEIHGLLILYLILYYELRDPVKTEHHKRQQNILLRKKDSVIEEYYLSSDIKKQEQARQKNCKEIFMLSRKIDKLTSEKKKKEQKIKTPKSKGMKTALEARIATIEAELAQIQIGEVTDRIPLNNIRSIHILREQVKNNPGEKDGLICFLRWVIENKKITNANDSALVKLMLAELLGPEEEFARLINDIRPVLNRLTVSEKMRFYLLDVKNTLEPVSTLDKVKVETGLLITCIQTLYQTMDSRYDTKYDNDIISLFIQAITKWKEQTKAKNTWPSEILNFLSHENLRPLLENNPAKAKELLTIILDAKFLFDESMVPLLNALLKSPKLFDDIKAHILQLLYAQIRETTLSDTNLGNVDDLVMTLKKMCKQKVFTVYAMALLNRIYRVQKKRIRAWWMLSKQTKGVMFFQQGKEYQKDQKLASAYDSFKKAEKNGYKTADFYKKFGIVTKKLAEQKSKWNMLENVEKLFLDALNYMKKAKELNPDLEKDEDFIKELISLYVSISRNTGSFAETKEKYLTFLKRRISYLEELYKLSPTSFTSNAKNREAVHICLEYLNLLFFGMKQRRQNANKWILARLIAFQAINNVETETEENTREELYRALLIDENCAIAWLGLRDLALKSGNKKEADQYYENAVKVEPNFAQKTDKIDIAKEYIERGQFSDAKAILKQVEGPESDRLLSEITEIEKKVNNTILRYANATERQDQFKEEKTVIDKQLKDLRNYKSDHAGELREGKKRQIEARIRNLEDSFENLLGPKEKHILAREYMQKEREEHAKWEKDPVRKREKERDKRNEQVQELLKTREYDLNSAVTRAKEKNKLLSLSGLTGQSNPIINFILNLAENALQKSEFLKADILITKALEFDDKNARAQKLNKTLQEKKDEIAELEKKTEGETKEAREKRIKDFRETKEKEKYEAIENNISGATPDELKDLFGYWQRNKEKFKEKLLDKTLNIKENLKPIAKKTYDTALAKELINLFFLSDGALHAMLSALLSRTKYGKDLIFIRGILPSFNEQFFKKLDQYLNGEPHAQQFFIQFNSKNSKLLKTIRDSIILMRNRNFDFIDKGYRDAIHFCQAMLGCMKKDFKTAILSSTKCLEGDYRLKAQRLLVYLYKSENEEVFAWHTFYAMHREAPYDELTQDAEKEFSGIKYDKDIRDKQLLYGLKHLVGAPFVERGIYFGLPLFLSLGMIVFVPRELSLVTFLVTITIGQIISGSIFIKRHNGSRFTASIITGLNLLLPYSLFLMKTSPQWLFVMSVIIHMAVNLYAFTRNIKVTKKFMPYGTIEKVPAKPAEPIAVVQIEGADETMLQKLSEAYPDIRFAPSVISSEDFGPSREILPQRFLIDMSPEDVRDNINGMVKYVRKAAFVEKYPYYAGLDSGSVAKLRDERLKNAIITITKEFEQETFINNTIDARIEAAFAGNYASDLLSEAENMAMAQKVEDEAVEKITELQANNLIPARQAVIYDLRDMPESVFSSMLPAVKRLATKDPNLYMCLVDPQGRLQEALDADNILNVSIPEGQEVDVIAIARELLLEKSRLRSDEFPLSAISIVTAESKTEEFIPHLRTDGKERANFVIVGQKSQESKELLNMIPAIALMGILKRYESGPEQANVVAVECSDEILRTIGALAEILLMPITRFNLSEMISREIASLIQTAVSV